jgi:hypothetical protein
VKNIHINDLINFITKCSSEVLRASVPVKYFVRVF